MTDDLTQDFLARITEAHKFADWKVIEHWAKLWIQSPVKSKEAFRWLARSSLALHKLDRAAYAFNRVLDFSKDDQEAISFFQEYPSSLPNERKLEVQKEQSQSQSSTLGLSPAQRKELANIEEGLAEKYFNFGLFAQSAQRFEQAFFWHPCESSALGFARSLHRCGESHKAQKFLREKIHQSGDWVRGQLLLANILYDLGQTRAAQTEWQNVLKVDPNNPEALRYLRGFPISL